MAVRIRKFMSNDSSSSQTLFSSPLPSFIYNGPKQSNDFSPYLIPLFFALGAAFLIVAYFTFVKKYYLRPNNQIRTVPQILEEDHGHEIDHPIWLITTVGLDQSVIDSIPVFIYEKNEGLIEGTMCSICLSEFQGEETLRLLPKCSHAFHVPCIDTWLRSHKNCPTCRAPVVIESAANTQNNEWESNSNHFTPVEEASNENIRNLDGVECYQRDLQVGRSENFGALGRENDQIEETVSKKSTSLGMKSCGFRVFSDLGRYREKSETKPEQVRRSISMDPASSVYLALSDIHEMEVEYAQLLKANDVKFEINNNWVNTTSKISKILKSSSLNFSLRKGPVLMKRSFSSSRN